MQNYPFIPVIFFTLAGAGALFCLYRLRSASSFLYSGKNLPLIFPSLVVLACLTIPMVMGFAETFQLFFRGIQNPETLPFLFISSIFIVVLTGTVFLLIKQRIWDTVSNGKFLILTISLGLLIKLLYIYLVDMKAISDFELMWNYAVDVARNVYPEGISSIQGERILPYFLPLAWLFGGTPVVYKISNVFVLIFCSLITYDLARRWFDIHVARASLILVLLVPETFFNSGIPSHDIPGAFFFLLCLWILDTMLLFYKKRAWFPMCDMVLCLVISVQIMHLQMTKAILWWLAVGFFMIIVILIEYKQSNRTGVKGFRRLVGKWCILSLIVLIFPLLISLATRSAFTDKDIWTTDQQRSYLSSLWMAANTVSWNQCLYNNSDDNYYSIYPIEFAPNLKEMVFHVWMQDTCYNTSARIAHWLRKAGILYSLGSQASFYYRADRLMPESILKGKGLEEAHRSYNTVFTRCFLFAFIAGSGVLLAKAGIPYRLWPALFFLCCLSGGLLLLGEVQSRYMYPVWFIGSIVIAGAAAFFFKPGTEKEDKKRDGRVCRFIIRSLLILTAFGSFFFFLVLNYAHFTEKRYLNFAVWTDFSANYHVDGISEFFRKIQPKEQGQRHFRIVLKQARIPKKGDRVSVKHRYMVEDKTPRIFEVVVHSPYYRPEYGFAVEAFSVAVFVNGKEVDRFPIADSDKVRLVRAEDIRPEGKYIDIEFAVITNKDTPDRKSWQRATLVNFEFAKLIKKRD